VLGQRCACEPFEHRADNTSGCAGGVIHHKALGPTGIEDDQNDDVQGTPRTDEV
jgi:hypothetical protein